MEFVDCEYSEDHPMRPISQAHYGPFLFEIHDDFSVLWGYGDTRAVQGRFDSLDAAKRWCYNRALARTIEQLQGIAPPGARVAVFDDEYLFVCGGRDPDMGDWCVLGVGHEGQCFSPKTGLFIPVATLAMTEDGA